MSTNISKQKRDDLIAKIGEIRKYISSAPQDENTGNLLTCLSELEKDVRGKKKHAKMGESSVKGIQRCNGRGVQR